MGSITNTSRRSAMLGVSALAMLSSGAAFAQAAVAPAPVEAVSANDIVVTAQRRAENLQNVPISITAVTGAQLATRNITDLTTLNTVTPGLNIARSGSDVRPNIRGINTEAIGANSDPRIGFYIDDVYQSRTSQALAGFVEIGRAHV